MPRLSLTSCPICGFITCIDAEKCECMKTGKPPASKIKATEANALHQITGEFYVWKGV